MNIKVQIVWFNENLNFVVICYILPNKGYYKIQLSSKNLDTQLMSFSQSFEKKLIQITQDQIINLKFYLAKIWIQVLHNLETSYTY